MSDQAPAADVQQPINDYWSGRAVPYDEYQSRPERRDADLAAWTAVLGAVLPPAPADVLDVGTGSGYVARVLARAGHRVTATDLSTGMLERARAHAATMTAAPDFREGDAVDPDFPPESFDAVTNRYLMWTLREPDRALAAWRRLLRPGGVLAVVDSTWFPDGLDAGPSGDFTDAYSGVVRDALPLATATSIDATAGLVRDAGFADVRVVPLTELLELDRRFGVAPDHEVRLQHLVVGTAA